MLRRTEFRPFASRGRRPIVAILLTFAVFSALSVTLSIRATKGSQHRAAVVEVAARQRTLAERFVKEVLLARTGAQVDPANTASILDRSAEVLLDGGEAPPVWGDDDETRLSPARGAVIRAQLRQEGRLVADLTATGAAVLTHQSVMRVPLTAHERLSATDPIERLRVLAALTSNVSLNAARTIASADDHNVNHVIVIQIVLGGLGLLTSLLLAWALIFATRRQTAHFRSLATSSTDLVLVFGPDGCRYVSRSVSAIVGRAEEEMLGEGFEAFVHLEDRPSLRAAVAHGGPHEIVFRVLNQSGEWRHVEAHVTDLRKDKAISGVLLNARDITERVELEAQLTHQAFHDNLTGLANRALFRDRLDQALARANGIDAAFKDLLDGKADYLIAGYFPGLAEAAKEGNKDKVVALNQALLSQEMFVAFSKKSPCRSLASKFGEGITELTTNDSYDQILAEAQKAWEAKSK
jgi:PAS domain S-box-containing protein